MHIEIDLSFIIGFVVTYLIGSVILFFASETDFSKESDSKYTPTESTCLDMPEPNDYYSCDDGKIN